MASESVAGGMQRSSTEAGGGIIGGRGCAAVKVKCSGRLRSWIAGPIWNLRLARGMRLGATGSQQGDSPSETVRVAGTDMSAWADGRGGCVVVAVRPHHSFPIRHGAPNRPPRGAKQGKALTYI